MVFTHQDALLHPTLGGFGQGGQQVWAGAQWRARSSQGHQKVLGDMARFTLAPLALTAKPMQVPHSTQLPKAGLTSHHAKAARTLDQCTDSLSPSSCCPTCHRSPRATEPQGPGSGQGAEASQRSALRRNALSYQFARVLLAWVFFWGKSYDFW